MSVIVFDFDGVITIEGEGLKDRAWDELASGASKKFKKELKEAREKFSNGRGDRYDILKTVLEKTGYPKGEIDWLSDLLGDCYNGKVQYLVISTGMYEETPRTLERLVAEGHHLYINSATPEKAVKESCDRLNISKYFKEIFGMPPQKVENLERVSKIEKCDIEDIIFIGDGAGDLKASTDVRCKFIGLANNYNQWGRNERFPVMARLDELHRVLDKI